MSSSPCTCRGVTKQGAPCSISFGLTPDGFCKFHTPNARQCLGISRTSGQRCKVKWDLDGSGYCVHHRSQGSTCIPSTTAIPNACRGLTKRGTLCSVSWGLDADGFCKYHAPNAAQCKGLARATGRRCKIKWGLDDRGYCQFHQRLDAPVSRQCEAMVATTGRRCAQTVGIDSDGFCTAHRMVKVELPMCREWCQNQENLVEIMQKSGTTTAVQLMTHSTRRLVQGRDLYHGDKLDLNTIGAVELDHILEKQCFAYAFQHVEFRDGDEEAQDVAYMLREEVVNKLPNLCLTRATTNKIKGSAVSKFLDDSLLGTADRQRLLTISWSRSAMTHALAAELQHLYVDMDLRTSYSGKTKPRAVIEKADADTEDKDDEYVLVDSASTDSWTVVDIKRTVKVETRHPTLSADAKAFVPRTVGLATTDSQKNAKDAATHCKLKPDEIETIANAAMKPVKQEKATARQVPFESTSEDVVEENNA
ncbi:hypothetical protein GQ600_25452 [Phytophthora cactorum]|nr:hypothetical protein GQ600_25452 [Phytophthora cactorum]